ncbi:flagellar motor switch protein FliM [Desulfobulbus alkaliphilus]|uniref:flagellar motor switch protein FliM n=1 Tax=Desulfobulbus alkaliphilus TaxID=869814 RepID=UPI0019626303|nr:FliM/FliN family flagellar motor switch protein [Desulfobulbus alkaliphilus]MBM9537424.1 FliM/FliN family flagellar motor switch protein [Desulfobulbus alkaliphilus]
MEPILTKEEIAELLAAIKTGDMALESEEENASRPGRVVRSQHIDLFHTYERTHGSGELRIPNLDIVFDSFARHFATGLTNSLQRTFTVERDDITTTNFQGSLQDINNQGAVGIYNLIPLKNGCLFHFDTLLAFSLLEIMLGSSQTSESLALDRNLTTIEMAILKGTMASICVDLGKAMRPIIDLQIHLTKVENNFRLVSIVEPETEVFVTGFTIKNGGEPCGRMRCIIPYLTLEPLKEQFKALVNIAQAASHGWSEYFARESLQMESTVTARSGLINMTIGTILALKTGDIIDLHYNPEQPLTIMIEDHPLFAAIPGERNGKKAIHITRCHSSTTGEIHGST